MRLSTDEERDEARALGTIAAAADAGVTVFDTARAYGRDAGEVGHNERLLARALRRSGAEDERADRDEGRHGPDPAAGGSPTVARRPSWPTARRASSRWTVSRSTSTSSTRPTRGPPGARRCARSPGSARRASRGGWGSATSTAAGSTKRWSWPRSRPSRSALSPFDDRALRGGVVERCTEAGIAVIAHSPLGGPRRAGRLPRIDALATAADALGATPAEVALAWLLALSPAVVAIPGARRPETARSAAAAARLSGSTPEQRAAIDRAFGRVGPGPIAAGERGDRAPTSSSSWASREPARAGSRRSTWRAATCA